MGKWYGSLNNRLEENKMFCDEITVGTGVTEYSYSDRHAYEVIAVKDQKHVTIREYDHKPCGNPMSNSWELISNEKNTTYDLVKRGKYWYSVQECTLEDVKRFEENSNDTSFIMWICHNGFDIEKIKTTKKSQKKYHRWNVSFGVADYYFDYEF